MDYVAVVVSETDKFHETACSAIEKLGKRVRGVRAVNAEAKRFADEIAADPSTLEVKIHDVVGFCHLEGNRPNQYEPLVLENGKPTPVSMTHADSAEWWVTTRTELSKNRKKIIAACARKLAEDLIVCEAMFFAIEQADRDSVVTSTSCDPRTRTLTSSPTPMERLPVVCRSGSRSKTSRHIRGRP